MEVSLSFEGLRSGGSAEDEARVLRRRVGRRRVRECGKCIVVEGRV
jgi:hypothetical protein